MNNIVLIITQVLVVKIPVLLIDSLGIFTVNTWDEDGC
ncbi:hypothetical protein BTHERMOSOX_1088 [Bathymodiolus thermophilus thioautotrophic gill symbiont]|uniref:NERD domain-containing protein n=1 Tax=Bathymodiolus thermophilus thioautotrophic gill symbiont TaxID=2360 RepID=A0A8H8XCA3_9GAMM|nr:hypothetical protein THERMOS_953 [Bathymodiolus thermophilus thioautotrophic gill symbiont]SHA32282.1 hypothetical protein BTHERMOSOX_1088 [Bathymodiolus thermophilus thioautotrophic gill symbiont]